MNFPQRYRHCDGKQLAYRMSLPYGIWVCEDRQVLFNREYQPIWDRSHEGIYAIQADPKEWVKWKQQDWFYFDGDTPWDFPRTATRCFRILQSFCEGKDIFRYTRSADEG